MGIKEEMAQDRCAWRNITGGPTRASADAWNTVCVLGSRTLNEYDDDDCYPDIHSTASKQHFKTQHDDAV